LQPHPTLPGREGFEKGYFKCFLKVSPTGGDLEGAYMITALHNLQIISDGSIATGKAVLIAGGTITAIVDEQSVPADANNIDLKGAFVATGRNEKKGKVAPGYDADMIVFNADFEVQGTVLKGAYLTKTA
jgi:N-acetylglucosamine-6-phosphate deacetylase